MLELRDLYDFNSNKTDKTYRKGEKIPAGYYTMVVITNSKGVDLGVSGGHPKSWETALQGIITEVKEEF